jgi:hypothetical protein
MFGARGAATVLSKATTIFGSLFMVTSLTLTLLGAGRATHPSSVVAEEAARAPIGVPVTETAPPVPTTDAGTTEPAPPTTGGENPVPQGDAGP